jgi:hypothetical protein
MTKVQVHARANKFILSILYPRVNGYELRWNVLIPVYPLAEDFCQITEPRVEYLTHIQTLME